MYVWTVANQKGGVGKTTCSVGLAGIAHAKNMRVLMIDVDPHGSLSAYFNYNPDETAHSAMSLFKSAGKISSSLVHQTVQKTQYEGLDIIPSSTALATLERKVIGGGLGLVLAQTIRCVKGEYDLIIIDCPPQLGVLMINALAACSHLVIPVQTEHLAIQGLKRMLHTLTMLEKSKKHPTQYCIVPTMFDKRTQASIQSLRLMRSDYRDHVWHRYIPIDTKLRDASKAGELPQYYDPNMRCAEPFEALFNYVLKHEHEYREQLRA